MVSLQQASNWCRQTHTKPVWRLNIPDWLLQTTKGLSSSSSSSSQKIKRVESIDHIAVQYWVVVKAVHLCASRELTLKEYSFLSEPYDYSHSFMQRPVHPSFGPVKPLWTGSKIWVDGFWTGKKIKAQKRYSKTGDIVNYALQVSVNGVTCMFIVNFSSSDTF